MTDLTGSPRAWRHGGPCAAALVIGVAFGAGDQYLGSMSRWPAGTAFSLMSAPWLLLPFCLGCTQLRSGRGALIGLFATLSALAGYGAMTLSPMESVHLSQGLHPVAALLQAEARVLIGGLATGPLYGLLGQRWRTRRSWVAAAGVGAVILLEPVTRVLNLEYGPPLAFVAELAVGVLACAYFLVAASRRAAPRPEPS